ncbi:EthD family reductase [Sinisalibacter aestuarii]|uniref:EthD domain-containing protein n=1 Tax=Sinisalibacter aestuarii TaxID=2949426 RepID=A0ABQ5LPL1_9RHOB|nr:EthD family reductase [Sinisalibacter aestuarii]GKY86583.1 hypothetical protein STA1M1_04520 [Sinisalibacter aestuarii]
MISRFGLLVKNRDLSFEDFDNHWRDVHGPLGARLPGLRAYYHNTIVDKEQFGIEYARGAWDLDGISELAFDDMASMKEAVGDNPQSRALYEDTDFVDDVKVVACEKHVVIPFDRNDAPFIKRMSLIRRLPGISVEEFRHEWLKVHADMVRQWPDVLGYVQNIVVGRYHNSGNDEVDFDAVPIDGIVEFWYRDKDVAADVYASDIVAEAKVHGRTFLGEVTPYFVEERRVV